MFAMSILSIISSRESIVLLASGVISLAYCLLIATSFTRSGSVTRGWTCNNNVVNTRSLQIRGFQTVNYFYCKYFRFRGVYFSHQSGLYDCVSRVMSAQSFHMVKLFTWNSKSANSICKDVLIFQSTSLGEPRDCVNVTNGKNGLPGVESTYNQVFRLF